MPRLSAAFYRRDALAVARDLIGCVLVRDDGRDRTSVRLVEVEAYRGKLDPGSHGYRGMTARTETMYGRPGRLYVYFTYGMHWCANIVCAPEGVCEAVLLRAGEPVEGSDVMFARRPGIVDERLLAAGPARLAQAMGLDGRSDATTLLRGGVSWVAEDELTDEYRHGSVARTKRIGLSTGKGDDLEWRWVVPGSPFASRRG